MPKKEKTDYVLEIVSAKDDQPLHKKEYTKAFSREQAERNFRIRAQDEGWDYFWGRDYVRILVSEVHSIAIATPSKKNEFQEWTSCPKCRHELEDDYCQNCGWRRYSQWYSKMKRESAILKGESDFSKE
ncbi:MAG: hypothetical protein M0R32_07415 [Candidatus Cloacimonetes bacterium]|jgi:hypothetical protein|nr:hypothetical protein [Candidatus Cloacimonadota bacterium]